MTDAEPTPAEALFDRAFFERASECSVEAWLSFLGHRWSALILYHLSLGVRRFGELEACLPSVSPKVLTARLRELVRMKIVTRAEDGREQAYRLTPHGHALMPILHQLEVWARAYSAD